jgi:hypothetical protein
MENQEVKQNISGTIETQIELIGSIGGEVKCEKIEEKKLAGIIYLEREERNTLGGQIELEELSKDKQIGPKLKYAYKITDKYFDTLYVLNSANAWWMDKGKVENLIAAYKIDCSNEEACVYAGISEDQRRYFGEQHPEFSLVKNRCRELPCMQARMTVVGAIKTDSRTAIKYLERKKKAEFSTRQEFGGIDGQALPPIRIEIIEPNYDRAKNISSNSNIQEESK